MDFNLSDEQRMLQENARRYMEKSYNFARRAAIAQQGGFCAEVWAEFAEMGWLAAAIPEAYDGIGFGHVETAILAEELGRGLLLEPYLHNCLFPIALLKYCATPAQCADVLPALGAGETRFSVAHSEPQSRGNTAWVSTQAERRSDGSYVLNGHKSVVVGAAQSDVILVVARTHGAVDDSDGLSLFALPRDAAGVREQAVSLLDSTPAAELYFTDVVLTADALLGVEGQAGSGLQRAVDEAILHQCAETVGGMEDVLRLSAEYLKTRKQFGVTIGSFQALQHRMADMAMDTLQARASLHRALAAFATPLSDEARSTLISGCKAQILKSAKFVTSQGIQLHGGYGITEEYRVGHHYRRLVLTSAWWGGLDYHLARYARSIQAYAAVA